MIINPYRFAAAGGGSITTPTHWWNLNNIDAVDSGDGLFDLGSKAVAAWNLVARGGTSTSSGAGFNSQDVVNFNVGINDYVERAVDAGWDGDNADTMSMACWFCMDALPSASVAKRGLIQWRGDTYGTDNWIGDLSVNYQSADTPTVQPWFTVVDDGKSDFTRAKDQTTDPAVSTWYHMVGTFDGTDTAIYIDGSLITTVPQSSGVMGDLATTATVFRLGQLGNVSGSSLDGQMMGVGIWDVVLTADEASSLYGGGTSGDGYYDDYTWI